MPLATVAMDSPTLRVLTCGRFFINLLKRAGVEADLPVILRYHQSLWDQFDGQIVALSVIPPIVELKFPRTYVAGLTELNKRLMPHIQASCIVLAGNTLQRTFARSVLTVMTAATPGKVTRTFGTVNDAVAWMVGQAPEYASRGGALATELAQDFTAQGYPEL
jgi:hypothetical protein